MSRRPKTVLLPLVGAMVGAACAPFGRGSRVPDAPPVVVDTTPSRPAWVAPTAAAATRSDEDGLARLARFAAVWHAVRWWHPAVVERGAAWDTAYLRHVEAARAARDAAAFADAVEALLAELDDPATRVVRIDAGDAVSTDRAVGATALTVEPVGAVPSGRIAPGASLHDEDAPRTPGWIPRAAIVLTADSVVVARPVAMQGGDLSSLRPLVPRSAAVLDLRVDSGDVAGVRWLARALAAGETPGSDARASSLLQRTVRRGAPDPAPGTRRVAVDDFGWVLQPLSAPPMDTTPFAPRVVAIVDDATFVPPSLLAAHAAGRLTFVSTGSGTLRQAPRTFLLPLGGGATAQVRLAEWVASDGRTVATRADTTLAGGSVRGLVPDTLDAAVRVALLLAREGARGEARATAPTGRDVGGRRVPAVAPPAVPAGVGADPTAPLARAAMYPSLPERLLAVTQLWGAARAFSPYLPMADEDWDQAFLDALGAMEAAASARAYGAAILRFAAALDASQVQVHVPDHPEFERRAGRVPFTLRLVGGKPLVTAIDDTAAMRTDVRVGDEIVAIGGEPIEKRFERLRPFVSASNAWSREALLRSWLERGPAEVKATFRVRREGAPRDVEFQYAAGAERVSDRVRRHIDTLGNGVVRVRLGAAETPLPRDLASAPALIIDARGVTDAEAASWLAGSALDADRREFARDERSWLEAPPTASLRAPELDAARRSTRTVRTTPRAADATFAGPVAILADATTQGEGELLVLRLLAGGRPRALVGATTAGAVGDVVTLALAGGVRVALPVRDVRHADGRFLQRLGVSPTVPVTPTTAGVRSGRDEVLEAAQRWIAQQLAPPPSRRR